MKNKLLLYIITIFLLLVLSACTSNNINTSSTLQVDIPAIMQISVDDILTSLEGLSLEDFFESSYAQFLLRSPESLTSLGISADFGLRDNLLDNLSDEFILETQKLEVGVLEILRSYDRNSLSKEDQLSYDIYEYYLIDQIQEHEFMYYDYPINHFVWSYTSELSYLFLNLHPLETKENAEDYISRLAQVGAQIDQIIASLALSEEAGVVAPKQILQYSLEVITDILGSKSNVSSFISIKRINEYSHFSTCLNDISDISADEMEDLKQRAEDQITTSFIPGFLRLKEAISQQLEIATTDQGVWKFPNGDEYYEYLVKHFANTNLSIDEIHQMGLSEVERIIDETWNIFADLGYPLDEDFDTLIQRAYSEAGYYNMNSSSDKEAYIQAHADLISETGDLIEPYFNIMPERQVEIFEGNIGGFYSPGSADGSRPGQYHINVESGNRPIMNIAPIFYHEALPGHHFQISLAQESNFPAFRKDAFFMGQIEGWALYAEQLAWEIGAYENDPYGNLARLQLELLRSIRLVVDTGIHSYGWTRDEAIEYINQTRGSKNNENEIDRYIVAPAQALCYKIGQLKILELRQLAELELGDAFDIKDFHDIIIGNGNVPLEILETMILDYIEETKGQ